MTVTAQTHGAVNYEEASFTNVDVTGNLAVTGTSTFTGATTLGAVTTGAVTTGAISGTTLTLTGDLKQQFSVASGDGAISIKGGIVYITKGTAAALTIANPTATTDDGKVLIIISATAAAHTVSNAAGAGFNGAGAGGDVGTFGGAKGDGLVITAYQGVWYVVNNTNVTLA